MNLAVGEGKGWPDHSDGIAHHGAAQWSGRRPLAGIFRPASRAMVVADQRPGFCVPVLSPDRYHPPVSAARVRYHVMPFKPTDFTQVNHHINRVLVARALRLLDAQPDERIADLFCGLGNFTLPLATQAREVVGIEGSTSLTERALQNAGINGVAEKTHFLCKNLFELSVDDWIGAMGNLRPPADRSAARRGDSSLSGAGAIERSATGLEAQAHCLCVVQSGHIGA